MDKIKLRENWKIPIYVSSSWKDKDLSKKISDRLEKESNGKIYNTCKWFNNEQKSNDKEKIAKEDSFGVKECYIFIIYDNPELNTPGKLIEEGMAYAWRKSIFHYGRKSTSIFSWNFKKNENLKKEIGLNIIIDKIVNDVLLFIINDPFYSNLYFH